MLAADYEKIQKIKYHSQNIQKTLQGISYDEFVMDENLDIRDVCAFRLFQIGEHSNKLSDDFIQNYSDFNWKAAYRFRNIIGHDYDGISYKAIYRSCKNDNPKLLVYVSQIIEEENLRRNKSKQD